VQTYRLGLHCKQGLHPSFDVFVYMAMEHSHVPTLSRTMSATTIIIGSNCTMSARIPLNLNYAQSPACAEGAAWIADLVVVTDWDLDRRLIRLLS